jgi:hypothetical protein
VISSSLYYDARSENHKKKTVGRVEEYWMIKQLAQIVVTGLLFFRALGNTCVFAFVPFLKIVFTLQIPCEIRLAGDFHYYIPSHTDLRLFASSLTRWRCFPLLASKHQLQVVQESSVCCFMMQNVTIGGGRVSQPHRQCEVLSLSLSLSHLPCNTAVLSTNSVD